MADEREDARDAQQGMHAVQQTWSPYDRLSGGARTRVKRLWDASGFGRPFASLLRYELDMLLLRTRCALAPGYRSQVRGLAARRELKIHLGCGNDLKEGWVNVDCYPPRPESGREILVLDMRRGLPFADGSARALYSEHFFEHLSLDVVRQRMLPECLRILAPGGVIRVGVPDGEFYLNGYFKRDEPRYAEHMRGRTPLMWVNEVARDSLHQYLYDYETLEYLFGKAGFVDLRRGKANDSATPEFEGIDMDDPLRREITVYIEGRRP